MPTIPQRIQSPQRRDGLVTFVDGSVLEPGESRASILGRNAFRERVFPELEWGQPVDTSQTPLMLDLAQGS